MSLKTLTLIFTASLMNLAAAYGQSVVTGLEDTSCTLQNITNPAYDCVLENAKKQTSAQCLAPGDFFKIKKFQSESLFCTDPYKAICEAPNTNAEARTKKTHAAREMIKKEAVAEMKKKLSFGSKKFSAATLAEWTLLRADFNPFTLYLKQLSIAFNKHYGGLEEEVKRNNDKVKTHLLNAISHLEKVGHVSRTAAKKMRSSVENTSLVSAVDLFTRQGLSEAASIKLHSRFTQLCGIDGLERNAFLGKFEDKQYVVICPGWSISAAIDAPSELISFANLLLLTGHELGHSITDRDIYGDDYEAYASCLTKHHSEELLLKDEFKKELVTMKQNFAAQRLPPNRLPPDSGAQFKINSHFHEIMADFWGTEAVIDYMKTSRTFLWEREDVLINAYSGLCHFVADGQHPSTKYRIEVILRRNPAIHELMGCGPSAESRAAKKGCTLKGETANPIF